jgi:putative phosphoribosyl transferase
MKGPATYDEPVLILSGDTVMQARLTSRENNTGAVIVASLGETAQHSGYLRVADQFAAARSAVLMLDLLTADEQQIDARTEHYRWNVPLITARLSDAVRWMRRHTGDVPVLIFATGSVAAAALKLDAEQAHIASLILAGARTDLVNDILPRVKAPTLLLVGESDPSLVHINTVAHEAMRCEKSMQVIRNTSRLVDDQETIQAIVVQAWRWAVDHTPQPADSYGMVE